MPWQETLHMDQRVRFIADYQRDEFDVAELARRYGISRKTSIGRGGQGIRRTHTLAGEYVGLEEVGDGLWDVYVGPLKLGRMDERRQQIEDHQGRSIRKTVSPMSPD